MQFTRADCAAVDASDPLAELRALFLLPEGLIYLDGNSLGPMPAAAPERVCAVIAEEWGQGLIRSWNRGSGGAGWVSLPQRLGEKIARLIGAAPGTVRVCDSTSVNLYKLLAAALANNPGRRVIVSEADTFPTDLYIAQGLIEQNRERECRLLLCEKSGIEAALDDDTAVLLLSQVNYRNGALHDMARLTALAHERGALVVWDLAHSAGALPVALDACNADYAVGCGYKYLNGGPGAPAFLYVAERHQAALQTPLTGWFGHARPFEFVPDYQPAPGVDRLLVGTPAVLSMSALEVGLDIALQASMEAVRKKSLALSSLFMQLMAQSLGDAGFELVTSTVEAERGSQVSYAHASAWPIMQALIARGVIGDFRAPDLLRFGFTPLYTRFVDVWDAVATLADVLRSGAWQAAQFMERKAVT